MCEFREKTIEVLGTPLLYHRLDRRNILANVFGNPYIGLKHLRESISVGFISSNPEQYMTWWQEGSLHDL